MCALGEFSRLVRKKICIWAETVSISRVLFSCYLLCGTIISRDINLDIYVYAMIIIFSKDISLQYHRIKNMASHIFC